MTTDHKLIIAIAAATVLFSALLVQGANWYVAAHYPRAAAIMAGDPADTSLVRHGR